MYCLEPPDATEAISLTATGSTPVELLQEALRGVLEAIRGAAGAPAPAGTAAVPVRGLGADLGSLFVDLAQDLISQVEEFGTGLDEVRLDGLLRTDTGGYTAWGYLSGDPNHTDHPPLSLTVAHPAIVEADGVLQLVCQLRPS